MGGKISWKKIGRKIIIVKIKGVKIGGGLSVSEMFFGLESQLFGLCVGEGLWARGEWFGGLQYTHQHFIIFDIWK